MVYLADTNFLIRCWRDASKPERLRHLAQYFESEIRLVWVVRAEFLRGAVMAGHDADRVNEFLNRHKTLWPDEDTLTLYAQTYVTLSRANQMIGAHDLWIAVTALQHQLPLLTQNVNEFRRVPSLQVVDYTRPAS
jgi:predicted nucleic acid-binding protein